MKYHVSNCAIVVGTEQDVKTAALLFDKVIPLSFCQAPQEIQHEAILSDSQYRGWGYIEFLDSVLATLYHAGHQDLISENERWHGVSWHFDPLVTYYEVKQGKEAELNARLTAAFSENPAINTSQYFTHHKWGSGRVLSKKKEPFRDFILGFNFRSSPAPLMGPDFMREKTTCDTLDDVLITVNNIPFANVDKASWEEILEFRSDKNSMAAFRDLKLFLYSSYYGKEAAYIVDDLQRRLDTFERACKKHNFEIVNSTLKAAVNSKFVLSGCITGILSLTFGDTEAARLLGSAAMLGGISLEAGNVLLEVRQKKYDFKYTSTNHELAYLIKARELFGKNE